MLDKHDALLEQIQDQIQQGQLCFVELLPSGSFIECKCDLKEMYDLDENITYRVRYNAYNPKFEHLQSDFELQSEIFSFTYHAKKALKIKE